MNNFAEAWPSDFEHHTFICKVPDKILYHKDEHFLKYESNAVLVKPIDSSQWIMNKTITTATNPDTNLPYLYINAPLGNLEKIVNFSLKQYNFLENNIPFVWELNTNNWEHVKLITMSEYRQTKYLYGLLKAELQNQSISKQMIVMFVCFYCLMFLCCVYVFCLLFMGFVCDVFECDFA